MAQKSLLLLLLALFACKNGQKKASDSMSIETIIEQNIGSNYERTDQGTLALCIVPDTINRTNRKMVMVLDTTTNTILYGPANLNAKVSWHSDRKLLIQETPEVIEDKMSTEIKGYIYNLDTKEKEPTTVKPF